MRRTPYIGRRSLFLMATAALGLTLSCSGGAGGCAALTPIPSGRYDGPKTDNAINVRLSPNGVNYLNTNWKSLIEMFAPGQKLDLAVPCTPQNVTILGDITIADQGSATGNGRMSGTCTALDLPANVAVTVTGFNLAPGAPDRLEATIDLEITTGKIYFATKNQEEQWPKGHAVCAGFSGLKCSADFHTGRDAPPKFTRMNARMTFLIDQKWDKLLAFSIQTPIDGTQICGNSGAPPSPTCIESDDILVTGENNCGVWCEGANIGWVKENIILKFLIAPKLQDRIKEAVEKQSCQTCGAGLPACPTIGTATSTCQKGVCRDTANSQCVPRFLGVEGRLSPGVFLSGFGIPTEAQLDVSVAAGSSVKVDQGINLGTRAGVSSLNVADCVPIFPAPQLAPAPVPDFDAEGPRDMSGNPVPYHVGLGISKSYLDLAMHHAHQSGTLCVAMTSSTVGLLNTGTFKTFLPSLGKLVTRDGKDAPMMIVLRPGQVPQVTIGEGTFDPATKKPIKPLLRLDMPELTIDFYAMLDDRYVRLFSLTADISVPLSLIFEDCSSVTPALGDLKQLISNIRTANSELLAEDPKVLTDLIPAVIGFAEPAVAGALKPFALPALGAFKLKVDATKGLANIGGTESYNHLGIYAQLMSANAQCATATPRTLVFLKRSIIPSSEDVRLAGKPLPWPTAVLGVSAQGGEGTPEFAYRVDGGLWSTFLAPNAEGELEVSHPRLLLQGNHLIEVRSRLAEHPHGVSAPVPIGFTVDYDAPEVLLTADRAHGVLLVSARDTVTPDAELRYAYRVGDDAPSDFGPSRIIDLAAIEARGGVEVLVKDGAGHIGRASFRVATLVERPEADALVPGAVDAADAAGGCSSAGGGLLGAWALLAGAGMMWRRRRARSG